MTDIKNIPNNWEVKSIKDAFEIVKDKGTENSVPYLEIGDIDINTKTYLLKSKPAVKGCKIAKKGDLLVSKVRPTRGAIVQIKEENISVSSAFTILRNKELFFDSFAFYFFSWNKEFHNYLGNNCSGSLYPTVSESILTDYKILIPPYEEQKAIVSKIEELLNELENGKQQLLTAQQQLKVYRQSLLKWAFEGKLTNKNVQEGELPKGWEWVKLGSIATKITDGEHITPRRTSSGFLLLSARNIQNGYLALDNVDYVPKDEYTRIIKRCNPEPGDILISCSGTIGRVCRVPNDLKFVMVRSVALVKLDWSTNSAKFYEYLFQSPILQRHIEKSKKATAQANLFLGPIKNLDVIVCSLEEQEQIVSELESKLTVCDKIEETISQSLQQAETLRQSILKKAFEGKLVNVIK